MVKLDYLDAYTVYRTRPPIIAPENPKNRKKNRSFMVIAPTIEQSLNYVANNPVLKFRYLQHYFIEKRWDYRFYGAGRQIIKLNDDGEISALLSKYGRGNLSQVKTVTSYLPTYTARPMKNMNVLIECNHVTDRIIHNPKDNRLMSKRVDEWMDQIIRLQDTTICGDYVNTVFIPLDLWFTKEEFINPAMTLRKISKNPMGVFLEKLCHPECLKAFNSVVLILDNMLLILDSNQIPDKFASDAYGYTYDQIKRFMTKVKNKIKGNDATVVDVGAESEEELDAAEDNSVSKLAEAEKKTNDDVMVDDVLTKAKIDPDKVSDKTKKEVKAAVTTNRPVIKDKKIPPVQLSDDEVVANNDENLPKLAADDKTVVPSATQDIIAKAALEGQSIASTKRNEMLKKKHETLKMGNEQLADIYKPREVEAIPDVKPEVHSVNENMKAIKMQRFEEVYNENLMQYDLANILLHFGKVHPAMYLNKDIKVEDVSTATDRVVRYTVEFEDETRKRHHFTFDMPKIYQEKYLYLNDMKLNISHQKLPFPITKISPDRCQLVTNYNKIQVYRYGVAMSPRITKIKKLLADPGKSRYIVVKRGNSSNMNGNYLTTIEFDDLGSQFTEIQIGNSNRMVTINFILAESVNKPKIPNVDPASLYHIGTEKMRGVANDLWISGTNNHVYTGRNEDYGELSEFIINTMIEVDPKMEEELKNTTTGTKFMYSKARIMKRDLPLIFVMGAAAPGGIMEVLDTAKINYQFVTSRPSVDKNVTDVIAFNDGWLVYDRYPYENSMLLNGLNTIPTKEFSFYDLNTRDGYVEIFDMLCNQKTLADNMKSFYYMMVDPITKEILERLNMPTDFIALLAFCNGTLADNSFQLDSNYNNSRLRSNEIINAYLYRELAVAWSEVKSGKAEKFSIPRDAIVKACLTSNIIDPHSRLNPSLEMESDRTVKLKGPSGMNEERSFTLEKRAYHPSMMGVVAVNSTPSGKVAIARHMTLNPNVNDARGFMTLSKSEYDGMELLSPAEAMNTFTVESADMERVGMTINQAKQAVPVASQCSCPISYDMERVVPYLSNDFSHVAKKNGKVVEISNDLMIIKYDDGTIDDVDLSMKPDNNTDGGFYIMNKMDTKLKVGDKVKAGQITAYDKKYINEFDMYGDPCANFGTLARVSLEMNGLVYEDSGYITDSFAHRMATKITKQKRVILSKYANVHYMARKGQAVQANDPILTFDDTEDEFSSQILASMSAEMGETDEVIGTGAPVVSKFTGVIKDIYIYYTVPLDELSPSLRKIVQEYAKEVGVREKALEKYIDKRDSNTILRSSSVSVPDDQGKVKGVSVGEGVFIDFYIEYDDVMQNGDKGTA